MNHKNAYICTKGLLGLVLLGCGILTTVTALTIPAFAHASETADPVKQFAGRFSKHFPNSDIDGHRYWSDNVVEIVPVSTNAAYFRIHLEFYNGHACSLSGIAQASGPDLRYQTVIPVYDFSSRGMKNGQCVLQISKQDNHLLLKELDPDMGCKYNYCGARGEFDGVTLPWTSHRSISYMQELKASYEYRDALKRWQNQ